MSEWGLLLQETMLSLNYFLTIQEGVWSTVHTLSNFQNPLVLCELSVLCKYKCMLNVPSADTGC